MVDPLMTRMRNGIRGGARLNFRKKFCVKQAPHTLALHKTFVMAFVRRLLNSGSRSKKADPAVNGVVSGGSNKMSSEEEAAVGQMAGLSLADGGDREVATFAMS